MKLKLALIAIVVLFSGTFESNATGKTCTYTKTDGTQGTTRASSFISEKIPFQYAYATLSKSKKTNNLTDCELAIGITLFLSNAKKKKSDGNAALSTIILMAMTEGKASKVHMQVFDLISKRKASLARISGVVDFYKMSHKSMMNKFE